MRRTIARVGQLGDFNRPSKKVRADFQGYMARIIPSNYMNGQKIIPGAKIDKYGDMSGYNLDAYGDMSGYNIDKYGDMSGFDISSFMNNFFEDVGQAALSSASQQVLSTPQVQQAIAQQAEKTASQRLAEELRAQGRNAAAFYSENKKLIWIGAGLAGVGVLALILSRR